jgi:hypothetical protein
MRRKRDNSEYDKKRYDAIKADPAKYEAYLERKRRAERVRQVVDGYKAAKKRAWRLAHPGVDRRLRLAHWTVDNAVRSGRLVRPETCSRCGAGGRIEAHHYLGYEPEHRLDVRWLCTACHGAAHREQKTA